MSDTPFAFLARVLRGSLARLRNNKPSTKSAVHRRVHLGLEILEDRTTPSTITSLPYVITSPGTYSLASDQYYAATSGNAITVRAEGVTIDMQGHRIWSATGASTSAIGIEANQESYITIKNGTIQGFQFGVQLSGPTRAGNHVQNMILAQNWYFGLWVEGSNTVIDGNQIINTGGCNIPGYTIPIAIHVTGAKPTITDNTVLGMVWRPGITQEVVCLALDAAPNATVDGNVFALATYAANSYGIWVNSTANNFSTTVLVENNYFANLQFGSAFAAAYGHMENNQYANVKTKWIVPSSNTNVDLGGNTSTTIVTLPPAPALPPLAVPPTTPAGPPLVLRTSLSSTSTVSASPPTSSRLGAGQPSSAPSSLKVVTAYRAI